MKTALKIVGLCFVGFLVVVATPLLVLQHQSMARIEHENQLLKQQVEQLTADSDPCQQASFDDEMSSQQELLCITPLALHL